MANDIGWQNMPLVMPVLFLYKKLNVSTSIVATQSLYEEKMSNCIELIKNIHIFLTHGHYIKKKKNN